MLVAKGQCQYHNTDNLAQAAACLHYCVAQHTWELQVAVAARVATATAMTPPGAVPAVGLRLMPGEQTLMLQLAAAAHNLLAAPRAETAALQARRCREVTDLVLT
jgi:hypothetical protein